MPPKKNKQSFPFFLGGLLVFSLTNLYFTTHGGRGIQHRDLWDISKKDNFSRDALLSGSNPVAILQQLVKIQGGSLQLDDYGRNDHLGVWSTSKNVSYLK